MPLKLQRGMHHRIWVILDGDRREMLFEVRRGSSGREACGKRIADPKVAADAADMLNRVAIHTAYMNCPNAPDLGQ